MRRWTKPERAALEAVAQYVRGAWDGEGASADLLMVGRERIAVSVATVRGQIGDRPLPRLRFDRVVLSLAARLKAALDSDVPDGVTALITVTAPIRQPAATAEALEEGVRALIERRSARRDALATIHGNRTRIRIVRAQSADAAKVAVFVHNPDDGAADTILHTAQSLIETVVGADARAPRKAADRWLVVVTADGPRHVGLYREVMTELSLARDFAKALLVTAGGRVETLAG